MPYCFTVKISGISHSALYRWFCQWLEESSKDFRIGAEALKDLRYAVFGCGNSLYGTNFNKASTVQPTSQSSCGAVCSVHPNLSVL